jgi:hypothetical protein
MALYRQWRLLTAKTQPLTSASESSSTCSEHDSPVLSNLDQNQAPTQKPIEYKPAAKSDLITLSGSQLKSLIKEYTKVCVREELAEILETLLAQKKVQ